MLYDNKIRIVMQLLSLSVIFPMSTYMQLPISHFWFIL